MASINLYDDYCSGNFIEIEVDEYLDMCSNREKLELVKELEREGYLTNHRSLTSSISEWEFLQACDKITKSYLNLSDEEIETIKKIANRF